MAKKKTKSLLDPMTHGQLCRLDRDNAESGDYWFIRDGSDICIHAQKPGEPSTAAVRIPIRHMRRLVAEMVKQRAIGPRVTD